MSGLLLTMPIIMINMGGEMVYILDQRLRAQKITSDKAKKVLRDVVKTMFTPKMITELFRPQRIYSPVETKRLFEKLAHSSIMRLNETSMSKLYDLMTMGFKYQVLLCSNPQQLLQITLNHLETIKDIIAGGEAMILNEDVIQLSLDTYTKLSTGEWFILKHQITQFFQGKRVKVSLFLQNDMQKMDGTIVLSNSGPVPCFSEIPGKVYYHNVGRQIHIETFTSPSAIGCLESSNDYFNLNSSLGNNFYSQNKDSKEEKRTRESILIAGDKIKNRLKYDSQKKKSSSRNHKAESKSSGRDELNLLSSLMGLSKSSKYNDDDDDRKADEKPFRFTLFPGDDKLSLDDYNDNNDIITINIDGTSEWKDINERMNELGFDDSDDDAKDYKRYKNSKHSDDSDDSDDDDLLALMDSIK